MITIEFYSDLLWGEGFIMPEVGNTDSPETKTANGLEGKDVALQVHMHIAYLGNYM